MKIGLIVAPGARTPQVVQRAEELGFDSAWFVDSPMVFGDALVSMAASAALTSRITLATGVTNPVLRSSPVLASGVASLNALAPGRIVAGIGTGFTSTGALGLPAANLAHLERFVTELRTMMTGGVAPVTMPDGTATHAGFVHPEMPWVDVTDPVPVYVAAAGPKILARASTYADGLVLGGITHPDVIAACRDVVDDSRRTAGIAGDLELAVTPSVYVTDDDVDLDDEADFVRLRELLGPKSLAPAISFSRISERSERVSPDLASALVAVRTAYRPPADDDGDPATRHIRAHRGYMQHLTDDQRPLATREVLHATTICGSPSQCIDQLRRLEGTGVGHVVLSALPQHLDDVMTAFGERVLPELRR